MKSIIIFGGSGFVGMHLALQIGDYLDRIYIADLRQPGWRLPPGFPGNPRVVFLYCDVRTPIDTTPFEGEIVAIVNLAAIHTSPGHQIHEYFETNILGARNICAFAESQRVERIIFTSSISVYGSNEDERTEECVPMPTIAYGSSKAIAEYIHREWFFRDENRRTLWILRPGVIFGQGEGGNFTRLANALQHGFFPFPGRIDTIKACVYVKDVCRFIVQAFDGPKGLNLFNFCYPEKITIGDVVAAFKKALGYRAWTPIFPLWLITILIFMLRLLKVPLTQQMGAEPDRVAKLNNSTNISSKKLIQFGFVFEYDLITGMKDWAGSCKGQKNLS